MNQKHSLLLAFTSILPLMLLLGSCASAKPPAIEDASNCTYLVITEETVQVLPGDMSGMRTSGFNIYLQGGEAPVPGRIVDVSLLSAGETLETMPTIPVFGQPSGVEIAILPDMDPTLLADYPGVGETNTNKRYYFRDVVDAVINSTAIGESDYAVSNVALVSKPSGATERFVTANDTYNTLLKALPEVGSLDRSTAMERVHSQLRNWSGRPGSKPRLVLILRLQSTPAQISTYANIVDGFDPLGTLPTVIVDIGHSGDALKEGQLTIVPLGDSPRRFDASNWPSSQDWVDRQEEMRGRLSEALPESIGNMSQVFGVPELHWKVLLSEDQAKTAVLKVSTQVGPAGKSVCTTSLSFPTGPRSDTSGYLIEKGLVFVLTSLVGAAVLAVRKIQ